MAIFRFNNDYFEKIEQTQFFNEGILERQHLQNALKKQIDVIAPDVLIISEEFSEWSDSRRRIDLLGVDREGNIVVIELKRTETGEHMDLQAIRYASMVSTLTFGRAVEIFNKYLNTIESELNAEDELSSYLGDNIEHFASDVRIILGNHSAPHHPRQKRSTFKSSGMLLKVDRFCLGWWGAEWLRITLMEKKVWAKEMLF